jgi:hypothetical protein
MFINLFNGMGFIASNDKMIRYDELIRMWKEMIMATFKEKS